MKYLHHIFRRHVTWAFYTNQPEYLDNFIKAFKNQEKYNEWWKREIFHVAITEWLFPKFWFSGSGRGMLEDWFKYRLPDVNDEVKKVVY